MSENLGTFHSEIEYLRNQIDTLNAQLSSNAYLIEKLDKLHEDAVESAWSGNSELKQWVCTFPFSRVRIDASGDVFSCCPQYLKKGKQEYSLGNVFFNTFDEIWNSDKAKKLRYSVSQGNFEYCNKICSVLTSPSSHPDAIIPRKTAGYHYKRWQDCHQDKSPAIVGTAIDDSCNLHCITCRNHVRVKSDEENKRISYILEEFIRPALKNCEKLLYCMNGEFLVSKPYQQFLQTITPSDFPSLTLTLYTNGQLFTPERWGKFQTNLKGMEVHLNVSIDATSKDVYEKIRRGAKWETLCKNMEYISSLRATGGISKLVTAFVVQKNNLYEINDFVFLAKKWCVDNIHFQRFYKPSYIDSQVYAEHDVFSLENPMRSEAERIMTKLLRETTGITITTEGMPIGADS